MLFDGTRLVPHNKYQELIQTLQESDSTLDRDAAEHILAKQRVIPVHPNFRIIATATLPSSMSGSDTASSSGSLPTSAIGDIFSPEVVPLFHYHHVTAPTAATELKQLLRIAGISLSLSLSH